jgi:predicted RNA-binding Zn-ribbon protein involved in translation (DUF1610 family)
VQVDPEEKSQTTAKPEERKPAAETAVPRCPNCGWRNVRIAHTKGWLDVFLSATFSLRRFKCRSCGRYFRHRYRITE